MVNMLVDQFIDAAQSIFGEVGGDDVDECNNEHDSHDSGKYAEGFSNEDDKEDDE